jgi:hypothetical protein
MNRRQHDGNTAREPSHVLAAVVGSYAQSRGLTAQGIPATTYEAILGQPADVVAGYFSDENGAQLYVRPADRRQAEAVAEKLTRVGVPVRIVPMDRSDLP